MPRYFFNMDDGRTAIDNEGSDLPDLTAAQEEALVTSADMMRDGGGPDLWSGKSWRMWVTDHPGRRDGPTISRPMPRLSRAFPCRGQLS
jgi:hypothetical protein